MKNTKENKITNGWLVYFVASILIVYAGSIFQKSTILYIVSSMCGVIYSLLIAKEKRLAFVFGIINVSIYGYILLAEKMYGGAVYNILYSLPMLIWGYIKWKKIKNETNSGVKIISKKNRIILATILLVIMIIYGTGLKLTGGSNYVLDSITSVLGYVGIFLMSNKYIEQWTVWIISNGANLILWILLTIQSPSNLPMLLMWLIYLINSIYGYITWKKCYTKK